MLKVVGTTSVEAEFIELSGYTLSLRWNNPCPHGHIFWRTGNFRSSLLEIGLSEDNHSLEVLKIVIVQHDWVSQTEIMDFDNPNIPRQVGLPIIDWTYDRPSPRVIDEAGIFNIHIAADHLSIRFGDEGKITKILVANRMLFGLDDDTLQAMQFTNLQPHEVAAIKSTFPTFQGD